MLVIVVTGGRHYGRTYMEKRRIFSVLGELLHKHGSLRIIQGERERGADAVTREWASKAALRRPSPVELIGEPAARMLEQKPDLVVAFPGTADCVERARKMGIEVMEVEG